MKTQQLLTRRERNEILVAKVVTKFRLSRRDGERCNRCKVRMYCSDLTIDHIHPKFLGGNEELPNKQLLCLLCHRKKSCLEQNKAQEKHKKSEVSK
jgi:Restriction endonuclease